MKKKETYETPILRVEVIELEQGIAVGSTTIEDWKDGNDINSDDNNSSW